MNTDFLKEELEYLASVYGDGEHVDISASNYFQEALDYILSPEYIISTHTTPSGGNGDEADV